VFIENHRYLRALAQVVDADAYLTLSENESDGGEQTMPRGGIATARGGQWTVVQVGSILRRVAIP